MNGCACSRIDAATHEFQFARDHLTALGARPIASLTQVQDKTRVLVGGSSPIGNDPPPPAGSRSSTSKTKPGCST